MTLTFDYPLEELVTYHGINPKPADHSAYWIAALAEMHAVEPEIELVPADFRCPFADCFHLYFTGVGGARVHAQLLRSKDSQEPSPAVLFYHGYSGHAGDWTHKLAYVAAGYTVAAMDCRGQGGLSEDAGRVTGNTHRGHIIRGLADALEGRPEKLYYRQVFLDAAQVAGILMDMDNVDETRVGTTGASQGGALAIACSALEPRVKMCAPVTPFLSDYLRVWEMDLARDAYQELRDWFRAFDPQHKLRDQVFTQLGYVDIQHLAERIQARTTWYIGLADIVCPPSSQFAAYNKITAHKSLKIYPDFGHENLPGCSDEIFELMMGIRI